MQALKSEEVKRHFRIHAQAEDLEDCASDDPWRSFAGSHRRNLSAVRRRRVLEFDEDEWDLLVTTEKEEESEGMVDHRAHPSALS